MKRPTPAWAMALASRLFMRLAVGLLGTQQTAWAQAMQAEMACLGSESKALAFAWGCLCAALGHALAATRGRWAQARNARDDHQADQADSANGADSATGAAQTGVLTCTVAVLAGCAYMHSTGAPGHYTGMNLLSLALAVVTFRLLPRQRLQADALLRAKWSCALGAVLLVASLGQVANGASPWLRVGPVPLNLAWLLLPALLVASDTRQQASAKPWALGGLLMACSALVLQADPLLLGLAATVLGLLAWQQRSSALALLALASSALAAHLSPAWQAPEAVAFVDQVVHRGFEQNPATGLALLLLQLLPLWPALRHRRARVHGWVWGLLVALSLPGWLPSPLVGFGGSFILGYLLSLALVGSDTPVRRSASGRGPLPAPSPTRSRCA